MILAANDLTAYLDAAGIEGYDGWDATEQHDALLMAEEWVTAKTDREFEVQAELERYFNGNGLQEIEIPDALAINEVKLNGSAITAYQALPLNGSPKERLRKNSGVWVRPTTTLGNLVVKGTWGHAAQVPQRIKDAICLVATTRGIGSGLVPNPTEQQIKSASAFSLSYTLATEKDQGAAADLIYREAERLLQGYIDFTGRRTRALTGT